MGIPNDDVVLIQEPQSSGDPTVITVSCPDKTGLGCDLCRILLLFGLNILKGDMSTDGRWCYIVFWVVGRPPRANTRWALMKKRLLELCPVVPTLLPLDEVGLLAPKPQVYLLKFSCYDRMGLLHDVTQVLCELELTIRRVKVSTTPDGRVLDLFFITDNKGQLHLKMRREETCDKLSSVLGDSMTSCEIEVANDNMSCCVNASLSIPPTATEEMFAPELPKEESLLLPGNRYSYNTSSDGNTNLSVKVDNLLSPAHTLIQIQCGDYKGLLYDIMRTLKDYNIQLSYGRFYKSENSHCEIDLFVVQMDGRKIIDTQKQEALCFRIRMELCSPLRITLANRGPDTELLVANPVERSGKGRPLVFYDITLALKILQVRIFLAEIARHLVGDREWEVYRVHLGEGHELSVSGSKIKEQVTKTLMGWE